MAQARSLHLEIPMRIFIQWWIGVFILSAVSLSFFGLIPEKGREIQNKFFTLFMNHDLSAAETDEVSGAPAAPPIERPIRVRIPSIGTDYQIVVPADTSIATLDAALVEGVVHYPGSGLLGENANILLFGHSSNLKYVRNPAFKALTGIQNLRTGDTVIISGDLYEYHYRIESLRLADKDEELVKFESGTPLLTISTCDTFGKKDDRYVLRAKLVEKIIISTER